MKQMGKTAAAVTMEDIDIANRDLNFINAMVGTLSVIDGLNNIDSLKSGIISAFCSVAFEKIEGLEKFIESVHAATPGKPCRRDMKAA